LTAYTGFGKIRRVEGDPATNEDLSGPRTPTQRDADRILYSSAFRRLSGVTQVVSPQDDYVYHDRLQHSLKVAQVAHRMAQEFQQNLGDSAPEFAARIDPEAAYAAALAHDLGHPPFGHAAEHELRHILLGDIGEDGRPRRGALPFLEDGFDGNAQTFRIVTSIGFRKFSDDQDGNTGLNLSWRTLAAVLKYPWLKDGHPREDLQHKWGSYHSESKILEWVIERATAEKIWGDRSIEAEVMDWADDVAYAVHDVEDFYRAGLIPLATLRQSNAEWDTITGDIAVRLRSDSQIEWDDGIFEATAEDIRKRLPTESYRGSSNNRYELHEFASYTIRRLTRSDALEVSENHFVPSNQARIRSEFLKKLTLFYVIAHPSTTMMERGQRKVIRDLFFNLFDFASEAWIPPHPYRRRTLPARLDDYCEIALTSGDMEVYGSRHSRIARATSDFIASLTDRQAALLHRRLMGEPDQKQHFHWLSV